MNRYGLVLEDRRRIYTAPPIVSDIDTSWDGLPQPPKRRCELCPTLLRKGNSNKLCWQCNRRIEEWEAKHGKTR